MVAFNPLYIWNRLHAVIHICMDDANGTKTKKKMGLRSSFSAPFLCNLLSNYPLNNFVVGSFTILPDHCINILFIPSIFPSASTAFSSASCTSDIVSDPTHVVCDSTSAPTKQSILEFLQKSCGLSQKPAILASKRLLHLKSPKNPQQVLKFLKERGFTDAHIQNLISRRPEVLASSVERTLQPKLSLLEDLGMVGNQLGDVVSRDPMLFKMSVKGKLFPGISFLQKVLQTNANVVRVLTRQPWLLHFDLEKSLKPKLMFLKSYGINEKSLWNYFVSKPRFLMSSENVVKDVVKTVVELGFPRDSGLFVHAVFAVSSMTKKTLERKMKFFISLGLSEEELLATIKRSPYILTVSEKKFQKHMDFFVNTLKYEPSIIVQYPSFFMFSMESRILPRYRVLQLLQSMQLSMKSFRIIDMFNMSEKSFVERFIFRFGESSGLYEAYKGIDGTMSVPDLLVNSRKGNTVS
eukprot:Gb_23054 [translate_table: standard]